jgi:DNA-binding response OmpR family regulator
MTEALWLEIDLYGMSTKNRSNAVEVGVHRLRKDLAEAGADVTIKTARNTGYLLCESKHG